MAEKVTGAIPCVDVNDLSYEEFISLAMTKINIAKDFKAIYKPSNLKIIEIDGLDCVGKETFANELRLFIKKELYNASNKLEVIVESFPAYKDTVAGELLFRILRDDNLKNNIENWRDLFHIDQYERFKNMYDFARNYNGKVIYILDRGPISNAIYRAAEDKYFSDVHGLRKSMLLLEPWYSLFGGIDALILMGVDEDKNEIQQYKSLLENKSDRDNNEVIDYQLKINTIIHRLVSTPTSYLFHSLGKPIPIFSSKFKETWGNVPNPNYKPFIDEEYDKIQWTNIRIHRLITQTINEMI